MLEAEWPRHGRKSLRRSNKRTEPNDGIRRLESARLAGLRCWVEGGESGAMLGPNERRLRSVCNGASRPEPRRVFHTRVPPPMGRCALLAAEGLTCSPGPPANCTMQGFDRRCDSQERPPPCGEAWGSRCACWVRGRERGGCTPHQTRTASLPNNDLHMPHPQTTSTRRPSGKCVTVPRYLTKSEHNGHVLPGNIWMQRTTTRRDPSVPSLCLPPRWAAWATETHTKRSRGARVT